MNLPPYDVFPVLTSDNILLREILTADINDIFEISYYDSKQASGAEEALVMLSKIDRNYRDGNSIHWGIADKESNVIMGTCGYYRGFKNKAGELGCVLRSQFRGKGIMTSAMRSAIAFGFNEMLLERVFAITGKDNFKAIKLMERLEFKKKSEPDDTNVEYEILAKK
ncbi:MAG: GNAT family N-acetyltransferase [Ignavibacteria bacterium]|nr:GNAT family N-acetyltransferase [Ignavibacteria bacterium]